MTLFTAAGLLSGVTNECKDVVDQPASYECKCTEDQFASYVWYAYQDWYKLQIARYAELKNNRHSWLVDVPEMGALRAPGNTCYECSCGRNRGIVAKPVNRSKGCGGIMRVAPIGLYLNRNPEKDD